MHAQFSCLVNGTVTCIPNVKPFGRVIEYDIACPKLLLRRVAYTLSQLNETPINKLFIMHKWKTEN